MFSPPCDFVSSEFGKTSNCPNAILGALPARHRNVLQTLPPRLSEHRFEVFLTSIRCYDELCTRVFSLFSNKTRLEQLFFTSISKNNSESLNNMCGLSRSRLAVCVATLLGFHFESSLTIRFKSGFSRFPLHLSLLGHSLVNAFHFENVLHFRFFIVLQECKSANFSASKIFLPSGLIVK